MATPSQEYESRLNKRRQILDNAVAAHRRIGNFRLLAALLAAAILWFALNHQLSLAYLGVPLVIFVALVVAHSRVDLRRRNAQRAVDYYTRALDRVHDRWDHAGETGERFRDPAHPYAEDLDLFGPASLFQLLNTARTRIGEATLAQWLTKPASREEIVARQGAIEELRSRLDLREDLAILGEEFRGAGDPAALAKWAEGPRIPFPRLLRILAPILALLALGLIVAYFASDFADPRIRIALLVIAAVEGLLILRQREAISRIVGGVEQPGHDLALLALVLRRLEAENFSSPMLAKLRAALNISGRPASQRIARLERLIELLDSRDNLAMRLIGPLLLWTTQLAMAVEDWRQLSGPHVGRWLAAAGEMEALSSLACFAYENPDDPFPTIVENGPLFQAVAAAHPLLPQSRSIRNDLHLSLDLRLIVVSGSNMSGKSTLLRTTGVNTVLALAGATVRAESLILSPLQLGASIRINDSLHEGASRFYAEITRLRDVVALADQGPVLFLLDELLNGTNSHDRRIGAEGVVRGLVRRNAIGLVTTHDLALAAIADSLKPHAANMHFEDHLEAGVMTFDYRIRPGVVEKSNALELMRAVGLDVGLGVAIL
jgi:MutS domain V